MSAQELATRFAEAFEQQDPAGLASLYAEDATVTHPFFPGGLHGREAVLAAEKPLFEAFSEITFQVMSVTGAGSKVAIEWCVDATNTGDMPLPDGSTLRRPAAGSASPASTSSTSTRTG